MTASLPAGPAVTGVPAALSAEDEETLRHLRAEGKPANSLRALRRDLRYLQAWARLATGAPLPWPAPPALVEKFVAHHLFDPAERRRDPRHGMPQAVWDGLRALGVLGRRAGADGPGQPAGRRCTGCTT